jgi:hypothetical protein
MKTGTVHSTTVPEKVVSPAALTGSVIALFLNVWTVFILCTTRRRRRSASFTGCRRLAEVVQMFEGRECLMNQNSEVDVPSPFLPAFDGDVERKKRCACD